MASHPLSYDDEDYIQMQMQQDNDNVPVVEIYDQKKFIQGRNEKIQTMRNKAQHMNKIATDISQRIEEQDEKLDDLNKTLLKDVENIQIANEELTKAVEVNKGNNSRLACWIFILIIAVAIIGVTVYITLFGDDSGGKKKTDESNHKGDGLAGPLPGAGGHLTSVLDLGAQLASLVGRRVIKIVFTK